ncbi:MAG: hypothetical protein ACKO8Z_11005 [Prosthecobacter sp.]
MQRLFFNTFALLFALATSSLFAQESAVIDAGGLKFKYSTPWMLSDTPGMMRVATLLAKAEGSEKPLEAAFYVFPGGGGGVEANVNRWLGQFAAKPEYKKTEEIPVGGQKITLVTATGTFNDGPPMGAKTPKENYTLLGAIVPTPDGNNVFIKLTGPKDAILKLAESFRIMVVSPFAK